MTQASNYLFDLASRITKPYTQLPTLRCAMITGSVAKGLADNFSDIDMTYYYEGALPDEESLATLREQNGGSERKWIIGDRDSGSFAEAFHVDGIEVQIGHTTITSWKQSIAEVLEKHNPDTPLHKAMEGTLASIALYGDSFLDGWKEEIEQYPDGLAQAMVRHHLKFFPLWGLNAHFDSRDATIWYYQSLVEAAQNIIGTLAGLNRLYFTTFQFKRMGRFVNQMAHKPEQLGDRLERLFTADRHTAVSQLETIVEETITLIETHMPDIDTNSAKARIGWKQEPWTPKS